MKLETIATDHCPVEIPMGPSTGFDAELKHDSSIMSGAKMLPHTLNNSLKIFPSYRTSNGKI